MEIATPYIDPARAAVSRATSGLAAAQAQDKALSAAADFEAMMIGQFARIMLESVPSDGPFSGGNAEEIWRGQLAEQMGREIAKRGGIGMTPALHTEILRMQMVSTGAQ